MKLSEAIRLGAMMKPQVRKLGLLHDGMTCALGAALDAIGYQFTHHQDDYDYLFKRWPFLTDRYAGPVERGSDQLYVVIYLLNDCYGWTREQIADWVETIEPKEVEQPVTTEPLQAVVE